MWDLLIAAGKRPSEHIHFMNSVLNEFREAIRPAEKIKMQKKLLPWEKLLTDQGYCVERKVITVRNAIDEQNSYAMACFRAYHETING